MYQLFALQVLYIAPLVHWWCTKKAWNHWKDCKKHLFRIYVIV